MGNLSCIQRILLNLSRLQFNRVWLALIVTSCTAFAIILSVEIKDIIRNSNGNKNEKAGSHAFNITDFQAVLQRRLIVIRSYAECARVNKLATRIIKSRKPTLRIMTRILSIFFFFLSIADRQTVRGSSAIRAEQYLKKRKFY